MSHTISMLCVAPQYYHDPIINQGGSMDVYSFRNVITRIAYKAGLQVESVLLHGTEATEKKMLEWYEHQKQKHPKAIVFNYTGHGKRNSQTKWPSLILSSNNILSSQEFMEKVESIGAPFTLSLIAACNCTAQEMFEEMSQKKFNEQKEITLTRDLKNKGNKHQKKLLKKSKYQQGASKLFKKARGTLRFAAASPGEFSFITPIGSLGETAFTTSLLETCKKGKAASWDHMVLAMKRNLRSSTGQTPLCSAKPK